MTASKRWMLMPAALLGLALVPARAQAQAQSQQWHDCVKANLSPTEMLTGSIETKAAAVASQCKAYRTGAEGDDVIAAELLIEWARGNAGAGVLVKDFLPQWWDCVRQKLIGPEADAVQAAILCKQYYLGRKGHDIGVAGEMLKLIRSEFDPKTTSKPTPVAPADKRF